MTPRHTNPADDPRSDGDDLSETDAINDDIALREAIARLMQDEIDDLPLNDEERRARVDALREKIQGGEYMSEEKIGNIVDRLLRKWKL
jgi:anti-sigma28 factor (negative regulator of flagellin synthesis)